MTSKTVFEYLYNIHVAPKPEKFQPEEALDDFDDGWTEEMVIAVAQKIIKRINEEEGTSYKLAETIKGE